jgi:hypothetical protein
MASGFVFCSHDSSGAVVMNEIIIVHYYCMQNRAASAITMLGSCAWMEALKFYFFWRCCPVRGCIRAHNNDIDRYSYTILVPVNKKYVCTSDSRDRL